MDHLQYLQSALKLNDHAPLEGKIFLWSSMPQSDAEPQNRGHLSIAIQGDYVEGQKPERCHIHLFYSPDLSESEKDSEGVWLINQEFEVSADQSLTESDRQIIDYFASHINPLTLHGIGEA